VPAGPPSPRFEAPRGAPRGALAPAPSAEAVAPKAEPAARAARSEPAAAPTDLAAEGPVLSIGRFEDLIALAASRRDLGVKGALERDVRLVHCEDGRLEVALEPSAAKTLVGELARKLSLWTGRRWMVVVSAEGGVATVKAQIDAQKAELLRGVRADPLVQAVLAKFPGAEIVGVNRRESAAPSAGAPLAGDSDDAEADREDDAMPGATGNDSDE
jgi:DNA polymerase-3 subunit gamma/tau